MNTRVGQASLNVLSRRSAIHLLSMGAAATILHACQVAPPGIAERLGDAAVALGLLEHPTPPLRVDVLVDATVHSPGSPAGFMAALAAVVPPLVATLGTLRVWQLTDDGAALLGGFQAAPTSQVGTPARRRHLAIEQQRALSVLGGMREQFTRTQGVASPLCAALSMIGAETTPPGRRHIVLLSDLAEYSNSGLRMDWECPPLPSLVVVARWLDTNHYLRPGSLQNVRVHATLFRAVANPRCPTNVLSHHEQLQALWANILVRAGAQPTFQTTSITSNDLQGEKS